MLVVPLRSTPRMVRLLSADVGGQMFPESVGRYLYALTNVPSRGCAQWEVAASESASRSTGASFDDDPRMNQG